MCLFENYKKQPKKLKTVLKNWSNKITEGLNYNQCKKLLNEVEKIGFTFNYGLSSEPFNLRKK